METRAKLSVINNTRKLHIVTTFESDTPIALAWAETIPYQNDFSIIAHCAVDLAPYSVPELVMLYNSLKFKFINQEDITLVKNEHLVSILIRALDAQPITSEPPPDEKRVAPLVNSNEENVMTASKKVTKKVTKKVAVKATPKVERVSQNGILFPKDGSKAGQCWLIADKLAKKAGAPPKRADVVEACIAAGLNKAGASADFQGWRKFHGLVNLPKPAKPTPAKPTPAKTSKKVAKKKVAKKTAKK